MRQPARVPQAVGTRMRQQPGCIRLTAGLRMPISAAISITVSYGRLLQWYNHLDSLLREYRLRRWDGLWILLGHASYTKTGYFNTCTFKYSSGDGFEHVNAAVSYCQSCTAARNGLDGIGYHKGTSANVPNFVEINNVGRITDGWDTIDNGSSCHDGAQGCGSWVSTCVLRPPVHDVGIGTKTWNMGCWSHNSAASPQLANWVMAVLVIRRHSG